jgi:hypothetical protein
LHMDNCPLRAEQQNDSVGLSRVLILQRNYLETLGGIEKD